MDVEKSARESSTRAPPGRVLLGIQGVQGCGKSTLVAHLCARYAGAVEAISLDDFYLPHAAMSALRADPRAEARAAWAHRGNPGTHDFAALAATVRGFRAAHDVVRVPIYDKDAREGEGDRVGWRTLAPTASVLLVEGWCLGFAPLGRADDVVDEALRAYHALWRDTLDALLVLHPPSIDVVAVWRMEAERAQRGVRARDAAAMEAFLAPYRVSYERYLAAAAARPIVSPALVVCLDARRRPVSARWVTTATTTAAKRVE